MKLLFALCLFVLAGPSVAQVYSFTPKYFCKGYGDRHDKTLFFDDVDTNFNQLVTIDLDKKTITAPAYTSEDVVEMAIDEVKHDEQAKTYWIKTRRDKAKDLDKHVYKLKMNENEGKENMPGYLQEITNIQGYGDTLFLTFTNHPEALFFANKCLFEKSDTALSSDNTARQHQMNAVYDAKLDVAENFFDMHDGYVTWIKGKGRKAQTTRFNVIEATYSKDAKSSSLNVQCYVPGDDDNTYLIVYTNTYTRFDPSQPRVSPKRFFILMAKFKNKTQVAEWIFE